MISTTKAIPFDLLEYLFDEEHMRLSPRLGLEGTFENAQITGKSMEVPSGWETRW